MVNSIIRNHCFHCGREFTRGCVITTVCAVCDWNGHVETLLSSDCPACRGSRRMRRNKYGLGKAEIEHIIGELGQ